VFEKNANFFAKNWQKSQENCDHNIDPRSFQNFFVGSSQFAPVLLNTDLAPMSLNRGFEVTLDLRPMVQNFLKHIRKLGRVIVKSVFKTKR
jgi:hypothetical protein